MLADCAEHRFGIKSFVQENPALALQQAIDMTAENEGTIFVAGSAYLAGEILAGWKMV